jgi:hypothetical protein
MIHGQGVARQVEPLSAAGKIFSGDGKRAKNDFA